MKGLRGLRAQLTIAMATCVVATVIIAFGAAMGLMEFAPSVASNDGSLLNSRAILDPIVLVGIALAAILVGVAIAVFLAGRLGRQIAEISSAAKRMSNGDLTVRASLVTGAAMETVYLAETFNTMAKSIEGFQARAVESNAAIAHELRTPLAILLGRLQGMREGIFDSSPESLDSLIRQVRSLSGIVNDLTLVSLAEAGQLDIHPIEIDIAGVVATTIGDLCPDLEREGLMTHLELSPAWAIADPRRIGQVVVAMVDNVLQHAAAGRELRIETWMSGPDAVLRVLDRGPGISQEDAQKVFDPFWRRDASRTRNSGGSGLGLSVVRSIITIHGGSISAAPREGGGSQFVITLPGAPTVLGPHI